MSILTPPYISTDPDVRSSRIEARAAALAREWGEECHVYIGKGGNKGVTVYHPGPDPDHPRTKPDLVVGTPPITKTTRKVSQ